MDHDILPETVYDHADHLISKFYLYISFFSTEHTEVHSRICRKPGFVKPAPALPFLLKDRDALHLVYAEVLYAVFSLIICHKVIVFLRPYECPGTYPVGFLSLGLQLLFEVPLHVFEHYLAVPAYGAVDIVYNILDALVHVLDTPLHHYLTLELFCLIIACHAGKLLYEFI